MSKRRIAALDLNIKDFQTVHDVRGPYFIGQSP